MYGDVGSIISEETAVEINRTLRTNPTSNTDYLVYMYYTIIESFQCVRSQGAGIGGPIAPRPLDVHSACLSPTLEFLASGWTRRRNVDGSWELLPRTDFPVVGGKVSVKVDKPTH